MNLSPGVYLLYTVAASEAVHLKSTQLEPEHFFLALLKIEDYIRQGVYPPDMSDEMKQNATNEVAGLDTVWKNQGLSTKQLRRRLRFLISEKQEETGEFSGHRSQRGRDLFERAEAISEQRGESAISLISILAGCLQTESEVLGSLYKEFNLQPEQLIPGLPTPEQLPEGQAEAKPPSGHTLAKYGRDLTQMAKDGKLGPVIGRREEIRSLARILSQRSRNNPLLLGDPGVGKTAIVEGLALYVASEEALPAVKEWHIIEITTSALVAGTKYRGEFEQRLQEVLKVAGKDENLIIFIDEVHTLMGAGAGEGALDASNILKPALSRGDIRCIGATTTAEYRKHIEPDGALARRFQMVWVDETSRDETLEILRGLRPKLEEHHSLTIPDEVIEKAVTLTSRFVTDGYQPDKAIMVLDEACARSRFKTLGGAPDSQVGTSVTVEDVGQVVARRTQIPLEVVLTRDEDRLLNIEQELSQQVVGQDEAIRAIARAVRMSRAGLRSPGRPVVILFAGPTGTGKTELSKALSRFLFFNDQRLIRLDMSEYMESHSVAKIIGSPPGYVGFGEEPLFIREIRQHPYSVVLLDEIEKAHPNVLLTFLQVFDEGRLTDARGRVINCQEAIFLMTTNLGSELKLKPALGFRAAADQVESDKKLIAAQAEQIRGVVASSLKPELYNRIQEVVIFNPLSREAIFKIINLYLIGTNKRLAERKIKVSLDESACELLAQVGHSLQYGARYLQRAFDRMIAEPLSIEILSGNIQPGDTVKFSRQEEALQMDIESGLGAKTLRYPSPPPNEGGWFD